jgi:hypothetical protein
MLLSRELTFPMASFQLTRTFPAMHPLLLPMAATEGPPLLIKAIAYSRLSLPNFDLAFVHLKQSLDIIILATRRCLPNDQMTVELRKRAFYID